MATKKKTKNMGELQGMSGADMLRRAVALINNTMEEFLDKYTAQQLVTLWMAYKHSRWDFTPDCWTGRQVKAALEGVAPEWDKSERPVYGMKCRRFDVKTGELLEPWHAVNVGAERRARAAEERRKGR